MSDSEAIAPLEPTDRLAAIARRATARASRSPLYRWLDKNHDVIASAGAAIHDWQPLCDAATEDGIIDGKGSALTPRAMARTWARVRKRRATPTDARPSRPRAATSEADSPPIAPVSVAAAQIPASRAAQTVEPRAMASIPTPVQKTPPLRSDDDVEAEIRIKSGLAQLRYKKRNGQWHEDGRREEEALRAEGEARGMLLPGRIYPLLEP